MEFNNFDNRKNINVKFTKDQARAVDNIIDFIAKPFDPTKYIVGLKGAGGTGKTFVTNYIIKNCKYSNSSIICASPTHKACRVFSQAIENKEVNTVQSVLGLRLDLRLEDFNPKCPQFNPLGAPKIYENTRVLIIDEASMMPAKLVTFICNICKKHKIKLIFIGDDHQLAPVNELRSIAFDRCYECYELKEIVRQGVTNPITHLLELLRHDIDNKTTSFIQYIITHKGMDFYNDMNEGFSICGSVDFQNIIDRSFHNDEYAKNIDMYRIIAYTNTCVANWNSYIRNSIIKDAEKNIITKNDLIMSYETIVNDFMETIINNSEEYIIHDIVDYVDDKYDFKGFLIQFQMIHGGEISQPLFIIDHRDKYTIQKYHKVITNLIEDARKSVGARRAAKWKEYYAFKKKYLIAANIINRNGQILYQRDIDYGFAITSHKSQGSTYDNVFVDMNDIVYDKRGRIYSDTNNMLRRLYVACSRAHNQLVISYGS